VQLVRLDFPKLDGIERAKPVSIDQSYRLGGRDAVIGCSTILPVSSVSADIAAELCQAKN
jgi:hypothetical protein